MSLVNNIVGALGGFLWGPPMLAVFLLTGAYLTIRSRGFPFRRPGLWIKNTFGTLLKKQTAAEGSITQRQALASALAACLGTGNIVGVVCQLITHMDKPLIHKGLSIFYGRNKADQAPISMA